MLRYDYSGRPFLVETENSTIYTVILGYGLDGAQYHTYPESTWKFLENSCNIVLGTYTFDDNKNIGGVLLDNFVFYTQTDCTYTVEASNNNGNSWETVSDENKAHYFDTIGYQLQIKLSFTGTDIKSAYLRSFKYLKVTLFDRRVNLNAVKVVTTRIKRIKITP
jgi:hypothetical protein